MKFTDNFNLKKASQYSSPKNTGDKLPVVYGDLADGSEGIWTLPCINTGSYVYAFAGHPVLTVAEGNAVSVYADGTLISPADYTFNPANNVESKGVISTITFTSDQSNAVITVRGRGKASGGSLIDNIIDMVSDFLLVECGFSAAVLNPTALARAKQVFMAQGYRAAGIITEDIEVWTALQQMMGSFLGSCFVDGNGLLVLAIDDGLLNLSGGADIIRRAEGEFKKATQELDNIINQVPADYKYNYAAGEFKGETDDSAHANLISQGVFGVRKPDDNYEIYWCRDLTSVQKIQDILVAKFGDPIWEIEILDKTMKRIHLDVGDVFVYSTDWLYDKFGRPLFNYYWKIISVNPDLDAGTVTIKALSTNYYMTVVYYADGTYKADGTIKAGGDLNLTVY